MSTTIFQNVSGQPQRAARCSCADGVEASWVLFCGPTEPGQHRKALGAEEGNQQCCKEAWPRAGGQPRALASRGPCVSQEHLLNFLSAAGLKEPLEVTQVRPLILQTGKLGHTGTKALDQGLTLNERAAGFRRCAGSGEPPSP